MGFVGPSAAPVLPCSLMRDPNSFGVNRFALRALIDTGHPNSFIVATEGEYVIEFGRCLKFPGRILLGFRRAGLAALLCLTQVDDVLLAMFVYRSGVGEGGTRHLFIPGTD